MELHEVDYKVPGGKLIRLKAELEGDRIKAIVINGDFFLHPEDSIFNLEKALLGKRLDKYLLSIVEKELSGCQMVGISSEEIVKALMLLK